MDNFIITLVFILIGYLLKRIPKFPEQTGSVLNLFVIYVSLPAVVLSKIPELQISAEILVPALMPWIMIIISAGAVLLLSRAFGWTRQITGCLLLLVPLGNTSFLGIPMVKAFLGDAAIPYAVIYDQLGSFLALATYGSLIIAVYGGKNSAPTVREIIKKTLTFPPFIALIAAFLLKAITIYPPVVNSILQMLSATLVPVVMIAVGFQLTLSISRHEAIPMGIGLLIKLAAAPLAALLLCRAVGSTGLPAQVAVFEAGMSPMISAGALAILAGLSPRLTAAMVGLGMIISFVTLPLLFMLL